MSIPRPLRLAAFLPAVAGAAFSLSGCVGVICHQTEGGALAFKSGEPDVSTQDQPHGVEQRCTITVTSGPQSSQ